MAFAESSPNLFGQIALRRGLITPKQLEDALQVQQETARRLGEQLLALGYLREHEVAAVLEEQLKSRRPD